MPRFRLKVIRSEKEGDRTLKLYLAKPTGFKFTPGLFIRLILPDVADLNYSNKNHQFSLASAPFEKDLIIITRVRNTP